MKIALKRPDVGAPVPIIAVIAGVIAVAAIIVGVYLYRAVSEEVAHSSIVIATGPSTGTYHAIGKALQDVLEQAPVFPSVHIEETDGSAENTKLIASKGSAVNLAFVQGHAAHSTNARLVTVLFKEVLHILISKSASEDIHSIFDLHGKRVSLGLAGSGTRDLSRRVLQHFDVVVGEDIEMSPSQAATELAAGKIDAAFLVTAVPSSLIDKLAQQDAIRFLSMGSVEEEGDEAHALELVLPGVQRDTIPRSTYGRWPSQAIHTVSVEALLVARTDLNSLVVRAISSVIFDNRSGLSGLEDHDLIPARRIRENYDPANATVPYHPGAVSYYRREEPPFFVKYAEALSLAVTIMLALYSMYIAFREWTRRRMKNRVDAHLIDVARLSANMHNMNHDELLKCQAKLEALRRTVFDELVAEQLRADEAFTILQNHLRDELTTITTMIAEYPEK